jgi:hypothetical protein
MALTERTPPAPPPRPRPTSPTCYSVPGTLYVEIEDDGRTVARWVFTPAVGSPGYFGPSAEWVDGDELPLALDDDDTLGTVGVWPAIRESLTGPFARRYGAFPVEWIE